MRKEFAIIENKEKDELLKKLDFIKQRLFMCTSVEVEELLKQAFNIRNELKKRGIK